MLCENTSNLLKACVSGNALPLIEFLRHDGELELLHPEQVDDNGKTLLHYALETETEKCLQGLEGTINLYQVVEKLVDLGVDPAAQDEINGYNCLHYAMKHQYDIQILSLLLSCKNTKEAIGFDGKSPLDLLSEALYDSHTKSLSTGLGGSIVTFGKCDMQLGYTTEQNVQSMPRQVQFPEGGNDITFISGARYHSVAVNSVGHVYTWGQGNGGRLGQGDEMTYLLPTPVKTLFNRKIVKVSAGRDHTLALCGHGDVYAWGSDRYGQLGIGLTNTNREDTINVNVVLTPKRVKIPRAQYNPGRDIAASSSHSVTVLENGEVYTWGLNDRGQLGYRSPSAGKKRSSPKRVETFSHHGNSSESVHALICTAAEGVSCIATLNGKVWQWGRGSLKPSRVRIKRVGDIYEDGSNNNQMHDLELEHEAIFETGWNKKVETVKIVQISAGPNHVAAVSDHGEVYTWGTYADLLGHSNKGCDRTQVSHTAVGIRVETLYKTRRKILKVSCAKRHTCALDDIGQLWVWGHGDHGILGMPGDHGYETYQPSPSRVPSLRKVSHVAAADAHTIAIVGPYKPVFEDCLDEDNDYRKSSMSVDEEDNGELEVDLMFNDDVSSDEEEHAEKHRERNTGCLHYPLSLAILAEKTISNSVDVWNVLNTLHFAESVHAPTLREFCNRFIANNLDAILVSCAGCEAILSEFYIGFAEKYDTLATKVSIVTSESMETKQVLKKTNSHQVKWSDTGARKRLKGLEKKLKSIEDAEFKFSAVRSKAKKRDTKEKRDSKDKYVIKQEIDKIKSELGLKSPDSEVGQLGQILEAINIANDNLFCKLCQVSVPDEATMVDHVSGKRHRKMMARRSSGSILPSSTARTEVKPFILSNPTTPMKIPGTKENQRANAPSTPISVPFRTKNISTTPPLAPGLPSSMSQKKISTSLSSSIGSNCSWTSSVHSGSVNMNMLDIMHQEETNVRSRKHTISQSQSPGRPYLASAPITASPMSAYSSPVRVMHRNSFTSPAQMHGQTSYSHSSGTETPKSQYSYSLGSFMKDSGKKAMNYQCQSPSAWGSMESEPSPISKLALQEIQNEQRREAITTHSLKTSSWGYNETHGQSLMDIQQEQEKLALEYQSELLARKLAAQEQEACLQAQISKQKKNVKKYKSNRKNHSKANHQTQTPKGKGTIKFHRKRTSRKTKQTATTINS